MAVADKKKGVNTGIKGKLEQHRHALSRAKELRLSITNLEEKISGINERGHYVTDSVNRGRKGKKALGKVTIAGYASDGYKKMAESLMAQQSQLMEEEQELIKLTTDAEEYIARIEDIEMRNILDLYYLHGLTWVQVSHRLNQLYKRKEYTADSCRCRHDRFFKKIKK